MTRINVGIDVRSLTDEHLLAEHREIKRLPFCLNEAIRSGNINKIPDKFTLGHGHVLFFLDKMAYTWTRYILIHRELRKRGFNVTNYGDNWRDIDPKYGKEYQPTEEDKRMLIERISDRIQGSKKLVWHYYGKRINKMEAINLLLKKYE